MTTSIPFKVEEVLYEYDQPCLFTSTLKGCGLWAMTLASEEDDGTTTYVGAPADPGVAAGVGASDLPIAALFPPGATLCTLKAKWDDWQGGHILSITPVQDQARIVRTSVADPDVFLHMRGRQRQA